LVETNDQKTLSSINIALIAVWTALLLSVSFLIIYPLPGISVSITFSSVLLSSLTAPLLGPLYGTASGLIFGWTVPYVNPATSIGILTFLAPTLAALMSGLVLFNRWKEATFILLAQLAIWFTHPFAWYEQMPIITWEYWLVLAIIVIPPIRKWIVKTIVNRNKKYLPIALWCLAWIARIGGDVITGNNIAVWVLGWGVPELYPYWAPMTIYYAIADSLNCLIGAIIGSGVLVALKRSGIRITAIDYIQSKLKQ
jgi:hypothetical protein